MPDDAPAASEAATDDVKVSLQDRILTVRLDRPAKKNALTRAMYRALAAALHRAGEDGDVRAVVLTGTGDFFTSGNDLQDFLAHGTGDEERPAFDFMRALMALDKPVIAAVNGPGVGIGTTMLLHCDFVYAAPGAYLHMPFVDLAVVPEFASSLTVPALVGRARAAELLLLGEKMSAERAVADGFVNAVAEDPLETAMETAVRLAAKAPGALRRAKALMRRPAEDAADRILIEGEVFTDQLASPEARETMRAFLEKRPPDYSKMS